MNKYILYILLLCSPVFVQAQAAQDTVAVALAPAKKFTDSIYYSQRNFEPDFQEKYSGTEFTYENKSESISKWERFKQWLAHMLDNIFTFGDKTQSAPAYVIIVRVIAVLILLFVVYLIVMALLNKEGMWIFGKSRKNIRINDVADENIHEMDFKQLINDTKATGNNRLAVRYYYLWVLKKMSNREVIKWHWDKTNADYLYEIKDSTLKKDFEYLSYVYDYSWYGEFPLDDAAFAKAEKAFLKTLNTL